MAMQLSAVEKSIKHNILEFAETIGIDVDDKTILKFMQHVHKKRSFKFDRFIFVHMCSFMQPVEIMNIARTSKKYYSYHYPAWAEIAKYWGYKKNIIPLHEGIAIRDALCWSCYSHNIREHIDMNNNHIKDLVEEECAIDRLVNEIERAKPTHLNYATSLATNRAELLSRVRTRAELVKKLSGNFEDVFVETLSISESNKYCTYYTIKKSPDPRLYGYAIGSEKGNELAKWITGEYNTDEIYDFDEDKFDEDVFSYREHNRYDNACIIRKMPRYVDVALNWLCECICEECDGKCNYSLRRGENSCHSPHELERGEEVDDPDNSDNSDDPNDSKDPNYSAEA